MRTLTVVLLAALIAGCGSGDPAPKLPAYLSTTATAQVQSQHRDAVQLLYIATLGRPADPGGLAFWASTLAAAGVPADPAGIEAAYRASPMVRMIVDGIADSQEARLANNPADELFVEAAYTNLLNRGATATARTDWARRIASGELTRPQVALAIIAEAMAADPRTVGNKLAAASGFSARIDNERQRALYRGVFTNTVVRRGLAMVGAATDAGVAAQAMADAMSTAISSSVGKPQTIWFAPADTAVRTWADNRNGSADYMQLFSPLAPWTQAAARVKIFKMYSNVFLLQHLPGSLTDDQIRVVLADLKRRNIALAVEHGPLYEDPVAPHCGTGVEGFGGSASLRLAEKIRDLGGELKYLAMDEPFQHARDVCGWTAREIARNAASSIAEIRKVFPNVMVGDIEVVPGSAAMPDWISQYGQWMDAWKAETGAPLAFFHADVNWGIDYRAAIGHARRLARERGIPFGVIYNGWYTDRSDAEWVATGMRNYASAERDGETPEQAVFQSWDHFPKRVLPESDASSFTSFINSYFRTRSAMSLAAGAGRAHGVLEDVSGKPLGGQAVTLTAQPADGRGTVGSQTISGTVPAETSSALVQVCINQCGETGNNDMSLYSFGYFDTGGRAGSLGFVDGWSRWGLDPNGSASTILAMDAHGMGLHTKATRTQRTYINSAPFAVTPGSKFTLTIRARVSPGSVGSGAFALIFLKNTEHSRKSLPFRPGTTVLASGKTAADGSYRFSYAAPPGRQLVQAEYAGNAQYWPALAETYIGP
ncbi:MAG TPA: DUF4214 domain-containing protein [Telluria sp.]|nr:DUF4214 domain-containing protein [Telluria sp.]